MKAFLKAVVLSLRYKWSIMAAVLCAFMIAGLMVASISTILPVVKVVLEGHTAQSWIAEELKQSEEQIKALDLEIAETKQLASSANSQDRIALENKTAMLSTRLQGEKEHYERYLGFQPFAEEYAPTTPFHTLVLAMVWLLFTTILKGILLIISSVLVARVANATVMDLRRIYYRKALDLDQHRIDRLGTSNMMTHLSHNMLMISSGLRIFYGKCVREPLKLISYLAVAAYISFPLLLLSLIVVPAGAFVIKSISRRMKNSTQKEMEGMADVFQTLIETFSAIKTVRIFNRERTERRRFKKNAKTLYKMSLRISLYDSLLRPVSEILGIISVALSIMAGAYLVLNRETHLFGIQISARPIDAGSFIMFYVMLAGASDPARKMSEVVNVLARAGTACENLFKVYDPEPLVGKPKNPIPVPDHQESIKFEDVLFAYLPKQPVVRKVSLEIPFGQTVAIVGGNGSGKSTLMNLLARFYDPNRGRILLDGKDIRKMSPKRIRSQIAWVTQDSVLFNDSIWENVAYGKLYATDEEILEALKIAGVDQFVDKLEDGYMKVVGDDGRLLSAGQRQRVALARAIIADPKILVLDEATSQMDGQSESLVLNSLEEFLKGRTTFIVTHRESSLRLADRVVVMDNGRVVCDSNVKDASENSEQFQFLFAKSA
jgi:ATP-binding cassette subfamily B protein/subfamily B ATP-binding cassette protein MsbA